MIYFNIYPTYIHIFGRICIGRFSILLDVYKRQLRNATFAALMTFMLCYGKNFTTTEIFFAKHQREKCSL